MTWRALSSDFVAACRGQGAPGRRVEARGALAADLAPGRGRQVEGAARPGRPWPRVPRACALACLRPRVPAPSRACALASGRSGARALGRSGARGRGRARARREGLGVFRFYALRAFLAPDFGQKFRSIFWTSVSGAISAGAQNPGRRSSPRLTYDMGEVLPACPLELPQGSKMPFPAPCSHSNNGNHGVAR